MIRVDTDDMFASRARASLRCGEQGIEVPKGDIGPLRLSDTGRSIWWTGRVAIGLRYEARPRGDATSRSALWIQDVLLRCAQRPSPTGGGAFGSVAASSTCPVLRAGTRTLAQISRSS